MADQWQVDSITPTPAAPPPGPAAQPSANQWQVDAVTPTPPQPSTASKVLSKVGDVSNFMEETNPLYGQIVGGGKEAATTLAGLLKIIDHHVNPAPTLSSVVTGQPPDPGPVRKAMQNAAAWLSQQGQLKGWSDPAGPSEHMGAMGTDVLGFEGLSALFGGAVKATGATDVIKNLKQMVQTGETYDKLHPVLKKAVAIGLHTISHLIPAAQTAAAGAGQAYVMSGGDTEQAKEAGAISGALHFGAGTIQGPLEEYLAGLKYKSGELGPVEQSIAEAGKPLPTPRFIPPERKPTPPAPELPAERVPAAERFGAHEQEAAQGLTAEQLADLNQYRGVDENGTPTNIQQLGLPSQSVTEPYQFRVPGWSATTEAGDLLHEAGARYKQTGTRVVEGKGSGNMQPWEMQQAEPFDLPRYAQEPGAVVSGTDLTPAEPGEPPRQSSPLWTQQDEGYAPTSPFSHKEPIMRPTEYRTQVRPGSVIRQDTTIGGPSIHTTDPEIAAAHLSNIESIVQDPNFSKLPVARQRDILQSHSDVLQQMREYRQLLPQHEYSPYLHQPTFEPMSVDEAMARVGDMGDAANELMRGPKQMYDRWKDLTLDRPGGNFQDLNEEINDLGGKSGQANRQRLAEANAEMARMFNGSDPYLGRAGTPTDLAIARAQFNHGYRVKKINDVFTNAFEGADRTGNFNVKKLQSGWKSLVNDEGPARMSNTMGAQRYEAMNNIINDLAGEPAADKAATDAAEAAAKQQHGANVEDWKQRELLRKQMNQANKTEYDRQQAKRTAAAEKKQKWYYDLARNGWHNLATKSGMEAVANIAPRGALAAVSHKVGAALILKKIITSPLMAELAYKAAQTGTKPAIYAPVMADIIRNMHEGQGAPEEQPEEQQQPEPVGAQ